MQMTHSKGDGNVEFDCSYLTILNVQHPDRNIEFKTRNISYRF